MVALLAGIGAAALAGEAELLHAGRCRRLAPLAFGPSRRPRPWARAAPFLRVGAMGALAWGLTALLLLEPRVHRSRQPGEDDFRHLLVVLDVSPSMALQDAGPELKQSRTQRARALVESLFRRVVLEQMRMTVIAVYSGAMPVVIDTSDAEVVRNILGDLPMHHAFPVGKTDLFAGLVEAARIARPWRQHSASVIVITDGDTVPPTGIPRMPPSVSEVLVVGVGDPRTGRFIDGHQSRQDAATLRQIALRLGGSYHDGNQLHVGTEAVRRLTRIEVQDPLQRLTLREYALLACAAGAFLLVVLPPLLALFGTGWRPGTPPRPERSPGGAAAERNGLNSPGGPDIVGQPAGSAPFEER